MSTNIKNLVAEFARLDANGADGYIGHDGEDDRWPTVGFRAGDGGHPVISVHPDDIGAAVAALAQFADDEAVDQEAALSSAGVRCKWHV